jgi:hypothetical protein
VIIGAYRPTIQQYFSLIINQHRLESVNQKPSNEQGEYLHWIGIEGKKKLQQISRPIFFFSKLKKNNLSILKGATISKVSQSPLLLPLTFFSLGRENQHLNLTIQTKQSARTLLFYFFLKKDVLLDILAPLQLRPTTTEPNK